MIDIHNHILPGVDDGPSALEESIQMAKDAYHQGITKIVASPHHRNGLFINEKNDIIQQVNVLNELIQAHGVPVEVIPGQEIRLYEDFLKDFDNGELLPLNHSNYILLEFPFDHVPEEARDIILYLISKDYTPIIAHPERYKQMRANINILYEFVSLGALSQITASSFLGVFGKEIERFSYKLLKKDLSHFVASDAHNTTVRWFDLADAYEAISEKLDTEIVEQLQHNSQCVVENKAVVNKN